MSFISFLTLHVCYRRLVDEMPIIGSPEQIRLLRRYERGTLPSCHPYARQMRKLEYLTRQFRFFYEQGGDCSVDDSSICRCSTCIENGGF